MLQALPVYKNAAMLTRNSEQWAVSGWGKVGLVTRKQDFLIAIYHFFIFHWRCSSCSAFQLDACAAVRRLDSVKLKLSRLRWKMENLSVHLLTAHCPTAHCYHARRWKRVD